jgi:hypothetical protein
MKRIWIALLLSGSSASLSGCSTPLPCVFNDTPECEARWQPVMNAPVYPMYFPPPYAVTPPAPPAYGTAGNPAYCHTQPMGYDTQIVCR